MSYFWLTLPLSCSSGSCSSSLKHFIKCSSSKVLSDKKPDCLHQVVFLCGVLIPSARSMFKRIVINLFDRKNLSWYNWTLFELKWGLNPLQDGGKHSFLWNMPARIITVGSYGSSACHLVWKYQFNGSLLPYHLYSSSFLNTFWITNHSGNFENVQGSTVACTGASWTITSLEPSCFCWLPSAQDRILAHFYCTQASWQPFWTGVKKQQRCSKKKTWIVLLTIWVHQFLYVSSKNLIIYWWNCHIQFSHSGAELQRDIEMTRGTAQGWTLCLPSSLSQSRMIGQSELVNKT